MTVARAAQDEVEAVRKEMQEKVKTAQEAADRQVRVTDSFCYHSTVLQWCVFALRLYHFFLVVGQEREQLKQLQELQRELMSTQVELDSLKTTMASSQQVTPLSFITPL